jgi:hypothetical protein
MPIHRRTHTNGRGVPQLVELASRQAYHALLARATELGIDFGGHPTGIVQKGSQLFLYEDIGVGNVVPRIVDRVPPLDARNYSPQGSTTA